MKIQNTIRLPTLKEFVRSTVVFALIITLPLGYLDTAWDHRELWGTGDPALFEHIYVFLAMSVVGIALAWAIPDFNAAFEKFSQTPVSIPMAVVWTGLSHSLVNLIRDNLVAATVHIAFALLGFGAFAVMIALRKKSCRSIDKPEST